MAGPLLSPTDAPPFNAPSSRHLATHRTHPLSHHPPRPPHPLPISTAADGQVHGGALHAEHDEVLKKSTFFCTKGRVRRGRRADGRLRLVVQAHVLDVGHAGKPLTYKVPPDRFEEGTWESWGRGCAARAGSTSAAAAQPPRRLCPAAFASASASASAAAPAASAGGARPPRAAAPRRPGGGRAAAEAAGGAAGEGRGGAGLAAVACRASNLDGSEAEWRLARLGGLFWDWRIDPRLLPSEEDDAYDATAAEFAPPLRHALAVLGPAPPPRIWNSHCRSTSAGRQPTLPPTATATAHSSRGGGSHADAASPLTIDAADDDATAMAALAVDGAAAGAAGGGGSGGATAEDGAKTAAAYGGGGGVVVARLPRDLICPTSSRTSAPRGCAMKCCGRRRRRGGGAGAVRRPRRRRAGWEAPWAMPLGRSCGAT